MDLARAPKTCDPCDPAPAVCHGFLSWVVSVRDTPPSTRMLLKLKEHQAHKMMWKGAF